MSLSFVPTRANEWHLPAPVWIIPVRELYFSRKLLSLSSQVFCHVQRAPGLTADVCSSFKTFLCDGFCILQIHHFHSVVCSPFSLAFWPPCRQKEEIFEFLPGSHMRNPYSEQHSQGQKSLQSCFVISSTCIVEKITKRRWDYQSKSRENLVEKGQSKNTSFFPNNALQAWEKSDFLIQDFASFEMSNQRNLHYSSTSPTIYWIPHGIHTHREVAQKMPVWFCYVSC